MSKTIFIFNDGTGQKYSSEFQSNVAKIYKILSGVKSAHKLADEHKIDSATNTFAFYFRGIGTEDLRKKDSAKVDKDLFNSIGEQLGLTGELVLGQTIKNRVEDTVATIKEIWEEGDKLFLIGFSRGAASIRIASTYFETEIPNLAVNYMLIFDTVYSVHQEVKILNMPTARFTDTIVGQHVLKCDHLIAGDEMRDMFPLTPVEPSNNSRQILFSGSHSDVGGGNPSSHLSDISLQFALKELNLMGIIFDQQEVNQLNLSPNPAAAIIWDKFNGTGQRHFPRDFKDIKFLIHKSVFERANAKESVSIALAQLTSFKTNSKEELVEKNTIRTSFN